MKRILIGVVLVAAGLVLASCSFLSDEQKQLALEGINELVKKGTFTEQQADALRAVIIGAPWRETLGAIGSAIGSIVTTFLGIYVWRGPTTARKGLPPQPQVA